MEFRLPARCSSGTVANRVSRPTLTPLPPDDAGRRPGDVKRVDGGPTLTDRRGRLFEPCIGGMDGSGGCVTGPVLEAER